jgi:hypothetical protein
MRKTITISALLLIACLGIAWSAPAPAASTVATIAPSGSTADLDLDQLTAAPGRISRTACTVTCPWDPSITCTSQNGDCQLTFNGKASVYIVTCDGHFTVCEYY